MANLRKLQGEIDKTLKRVQEGMGVFDDIWDQLYSTDNANQREKLEANLKTEIKKLQRFRDQIKTWHASNDIKDKTALADARRDIERRMEKFKACEKEAKTKAFSKEGLQAAAQRQDPKEKAKQEMRDWLSATVDALNTQIEEFEAELEDLGTGGRKKGKPPPRVSHLEESISRHRAHIARLEQMLRLLDNEEIAVEDVEGIKDLVDDYLERNQDDPEEFTAPDDLYADVLEQLEAMSAEVVAAPPSHSRTAKDREAQKEREREERERERQKAAALAAKAQLAAQGNTRLMTETEDDKKAPPTPAAAKPAAPAGGANNASPGATAPAAAAAPAAPAAAPAAAAAAAAAAPPPPPPRAAGKDSPAAAAGAASVPGTPLRGQGVGTPNASPLTPSGSATPAPAGAGGAGAGDGFPALGAGAGGAKQPPVGPAAAPAAAAAEDAAAGFDPGAMDSGLEQLAAQLGAMGIQDGTAGLTPAQCLQRLQTAAPRSIPQPADSAWQQLPLRPRPPPVAPPPSYPAQRLPVFDNPALFEKLDPETLFFAFYQQPGSHQQYLAARALKQQSWRFHRQHQAWFQRHEEPKAGGQPGDDHELGNYIYFDNLLREGGEAGAGGAGGAAVPAGWCYRLKSDFMFKYDALEDEVAV